MIRLRAKYNTSILTSILNARKDDVLKEAHKIFNEAQENKLLQLVTENSSKKKAETLPSNNTEMVEKKQTSNKKSVTFATDLLNEFEKIIDSEM